MSETVLVPDENRLPGVGASPAVAPWFSTYNRYIGVPGPTGIYPLDPFPEVEFCAESPWQDHVVIAHHGVDARARAAGFERADDYIQHLIATSPKRGAFCADCPNRECAKGADGNN